MHCPPSGMISLYWMYVCLALQRNGFEAKLSNPHSIFAESYSYTFVVYNWLPYMNVHVPANTLRPTTDCANKYNFFTVNIFPNFTLTVLNLLFHSILSIPSFKMWLMTSSWCYLVMLSPGLVFVYRLGKAEVLTGDILGGPGRYGRRNMELRVSIWIVEKGDQWQNCTLGKIQALNTSLILHQWPH